MPIADQQSLPTIKITEVAYNNGAFNPIHYHTSHQLLVVQQGFIRVHTPTGWYVITPSRGIWLTKKTLHSLAILKNTQIFSVYIPPTITENLLPQTQVVGINSLLQALLGQAVNIDIAIMTSRDKLIMELIVAELSRLTVLEELKLPQPSSENYQAICDKIRDRLSHQWALTDIANTLGISERTVARQFYQQTGLSFNEWLRRLRFQYSFELLLQGNSVIDVALKVGYENPSSFSTAFKQRVGITPTQFVAQSLGGV